MAEILSVVASVIALGTAVNGTLKTISSIRRTCKVIKAARKDIETFAEFVEYYAIAIRTAHRTLEDFTNPQIREKTKVISYLEDVNGFDFLARQSKSITKDMLGCMREIRELRGKHRIVVGFQWKWMKKDIESQLKPVMASAQCNLQMIVSCLNLGMTLEAAKASGQPLTAENLREIKRLKQEIKIHKRTIINLHELLASRPTQKVHPVLQSQALFHQNFHEGLVELAESLVDRSAIPGSPTVILPPTPSSSRRRQSSRSSDAQLSRHESRQHSTISTLTQFTRKSSSTSIEPEPLFFHRDSSEVSSSQTNKKPTSTSIPPIRRLQPQRKNENYQSRALSVAESSQRLSKFGTCTSSSETRIVFPSSSSQADFISTYPRSYLLHLNPTHDRESKSGYICTPKGTVSVKALIDHDLNENIISQANAARLGLEYNETGSEEDDETQSWIDFGNGQKEKKLGTVTLRWADGKMHDGKSFPVHCWVCEYGISDLILGKPFLEKRKHYSK